MSNQIQRTEKRRCTARTAHGRPCRAWAVRGSEPARCCVHGGSRRPVPRSRTGADAAVKAERPDATGFYDDDPQAVSINHAIAGLVDKMRRLDQIIDAYERETEGGDGFLIRLLGLYLQASTRLGRMLRDRHTLLGEGAGELASALNQVLDELGAEWGVDL